MHFYTGARVECNGPCADYEPAYSFYRQIRSLRSFEPGEEEEEEGSIGRPAPSERGSGGERMAGEGWRGVCNLCRWHVQKLADNGAVANPKN